MYVDLSLPRLSFFLWKDWGWKTTRYCLSGTFLVFFLKTWLNQGVSFQLNTFWKRFQNQKQSSKWLHQHLKQCYSPLYFRVSMCSDCLTLLLSLSKLSHARKFANTILVKDCFHLAHIVLCPCSTSPENPYLLFCHCLLSQDHQCCSFFLVLLLVVSPSDPRKHCCSEAALSPLCLWTIRSFWGCSSSVRRATCMESTETGFWRFLVKESQGLWTAEVQFSF